jgi:cyclopropane fatty-acyl-phospholipid synthase-like methyltransferase
MVSQIKDMKGKTLMEIGSGKGECFKHVIEDYGPDSVIDVDISKENLSHCKEELKS